MPSVRIEVYRSGHSSEFKEYDTDDYEIRNHAGEVVKTPAIDMLFASAIARTCRAERFDAKLLTDRVLALLEDNHGT